MKKYNFSRYPEINLISREITTLQERLTKVNKVMNEINERKSTFYVILQNAQRKIRNDFRRQINEVKTKYEETLKCARYFATDLKRLQSDYKLKIAELNDLCCYQMEQRRDKQKQDLQKLEYSYKICEDERVTILQKIENLNVQLKERWNYEKPDVKVRDAEIKKKIRAAWWKSLQNRRQVRVNYRKSRKSLIEIFKKSHANIKCLSLRLFWTRFQNVTKIEPNMYELSVKINEMHLGIKRSLAQERQIVTKLHNDRRLNKGHKERITFMEVRNKYASAVGKMTNWKFIIAIKNAFFSIMPIIFIFAFFAVLNDVILQYNDHGFFSLFNLSPSQQAVLKEVRVFGHLIVNGLSGIFTLLLAGAISYHLSKYYKIDQFAAVIATFVATTIMLPKLYVISTTNSPESLFLSGSDWWNVFGEGNAFVGMFVSLTCVPLLARFNSFHKLRIELPEQTPNFIARSFSLLIPILFTLLIYASISITIYELGSLGTVSVSENIIASGRVRIYDLQDILNVAVLKAVGFNSNSLGSMILILEIEEMLWFIGLQPDPIVHSAIMPLMEHAILNKEIFSYETLCSFIEFGGDGAMFSLCLALLFFSKRNDYRIIAWISLIPLFFNINEPLAYGLPLVLNPIFLVPLLLISIVMPIFAWFTITIGACPLPSVVIADSNAYLEFANIPSLLMAYISTKSMLAVLFTLIDGIVAGIVYMPFVILSNYTEQQEFINRMISEKKHVQSTPQDQYRSNYK